MDSYCNRELTTAEVTCETYTGNFLTFPGIGGPLLPKKWKNGTFGIYN